MEDLLDLLFDGGGVGFGFGLEGVAAGDTIDNGGDGTGQELDLFGSGFLEPGPVVAEAFDEEGDPRLDILGVEGGGCGGGWVEHHGGPPLRGC